MNSDISNTKARFNFSIPQKYYLPIIVLAAVVVRTIFFNGLVFSDDSYYNWLSFQLSLGSYNSGYLGYPIFQIRKLSTVLTSFSFTVLGYNEIASVFFPFIFSVLDVILIYKISDLLIKEKKAALIASLLAAFFPVDIIFATINFTDLECIFFINLGIYFYIKALRDKRNIYYITAGVCVAVSILFKEYAYYYCLMFIGYLVYCLFVKKKVTFQSVLPLFVVLVFLIAEGIYYQIAEGNFLYRLKIFQSNYTYCYYDFFPYTLTKNDLSISSYLVALMNHIGSNLKYLFFRRYYLLLPILSVYQSYILIRKKEQRFLLAWFIGLMILLPLMTVSLSSYSPIELRRVWYIYPLMFPFCILTALLLSRLKPVYLVSVLVIYLVGSISMSVEFQDFFDLKNKNQFKQFIRTNSEKVIHTDHHTAYGIRFINGFSKNDNVKLLTNERLLLINKGELVIYNDQVILELKKQKYSFPDFNEIGQDGYKLINTIGQVKIYECVK